MVGLHDDSDAGAGAAPPAREGTLRYEQSGESGVGRRGAAGSVVVAGRR